MKYEYRIQIAYSVPGGRLVLNHIVESASYVGALQAALRIPFSGPEHAVQGFLVMTRITIKRGRLLQG